MDKVECGECEAQGGGEFCGIHGGGGCPCAREFECEDCDGKGYFCGDCQKSVAVDDVCSCSLPYVLEAVAP